MSDTEQVTISEAESTEELVDPKREAYCTGLEALAAFLRANTEVPLPEQAEFIQYIWQKERFVHLIKMLHGKLDKKYSEYYATVSKAFGPITFGYRISRESVCERKVIGVKKVEAREAYIVPAEPAHEEEVVSWECSPILASDEDE